MGIKRKKSAAVEFLEKLAGGPLTFGKMISSIRQCEEQGQAEFAKKLRISVSHLSDIENDRKTVSAERAVRFAKILGYSEKQFVRIALQDSLKKQGLDRMLVSIEEAA